MVADPVIFGDLAFVFVAAVLGGALAWWAGQPLILGYVVGGILISPFTPGPSVSNLHSFDVFAEVGVVLLMFSIGMEFSPRELMQVRLVALLGGPLAVVLSLALGAGAGALLGWGVVQGVVIGAIISVSSTMVLGRLLLDRGDLHSRHGRVMMGTSLVEDLAAVVLIVLIPALGAVESGGVLAPIALAVGKAVLVLTPFAFLVSRVIPRLMTQVARTRNQELFLLVALAIGLGTAALTQAIGLSLALGAFLAGLIISESDYAHETLARLLPLREVFGALFFVTVGALIDPGRVLANLPLLAAILGLVLVGKLAIRTVVVWLCGERLATALLVGVGLAQIGEFSFVLVQVARNAGHVGPDVYHATLAASLLTILVNALLVRAVPGWIGRARRAGRRRDHRDPSPASLSDHVVLCGFGRVGSAIGEALETFSIPYVAIELDPDIVAGLRARQAPCLFGDAASRRVLERAGTERAALVVLALPDSDRTRHAIRHVRELNPGVAILARTQRAGGESLARAGASEVIEPEQEAAATLIRHALRRLSQPQDLVLAYLTRLRETMQPGGAGASAPTDVLPGLGDVVVGHGSLADQSLREARIRERLGVTVVAVARPPEETVLNPSPEFILRPGDRVRLFGLPEQIEAFRREATGEAAEQAAER
jgi:CPA2 family monovalent cation:H+ antiporter-2